MLKTYILFFSLFFSHLAYAEFWPSYSLLQLEVNAEHTAIGQFLEQREDSSFFKVQSINGDQVEVIAFINLQRDYHEINQGGYSNVKTDLKACEQALLYYNLKNDKKAYNLIGCRLLDREKVYRPFQPTNPGNYHFYQMKDSVSWKGIIETAKRTKKVVDHVENLIRIENPIERNERLFNWVEKNKEKLQQTTLDPFNGWASLSINVFERIAEANIARDTWKASELLRKFLVMSNLSESENSFTTEEEVDFLFEQVAAVDSTYSTQKQALVFLQRAVNICYDDNYPIPDSLTLSKQIIQQKKWRNQLIPLLQDPALRDNAFYIISRLSNPRDANLYHRIDLESMPEMIEMYNTISPSRFRSNLAEFISYNSEKEKWKSLSGCDHGIFMDLYQVHVDSVRQELSFGIRLRSNHIAIKTLPIVYLKNETNQKIEKIIPEDFKLPYGAQFRDVRYLKLPIPFLPKGKYMMWVEGKAGDTEEYFWRTEIASFEK